MDWCRLWNDLARDPKFRAIAKKSGKHITLVISIYVTMLNNASSNKERRGSLCGWNNEDIAALLDVEESDVEAVFSAMQGKLLDGETLTGWDKRQVLVEDAGAAERKRRQRERERSKETGSDEENTEMQKDVTACHGMSRDVTECHAPDTDKEREEEKKGFTGVNPKKKREAATETRFALPQFVPPEAWRGYVEMRKRMRKPLTARAMDLCVRKLDDLRNKGHPPEDVLNQSVMNGWQGVFEIRQENQTAGKAHGKPSIADEAKRVIAGYMAAAGEGANDVTPRPSLLGTADVRESRR